MKISSVQNNVFYNKTSATSFHSWERVVYKQPKSNIDLHIKHCNNTALCRVPEIMYKPVINYWKCFVDYLIDKYKDAPKINIYSLGCSNGAEAITLIMGLKSALNKEQFSKFMPIKASDYDPVAIEYAKSGKISIGLDEAMRVDELTGGQFGSYFYKINPDENLTKTDYFKIGEFKIGDKIKPILSNDEIKLNINPEITKNIEYKIADVMEEVNNIQANNTIVNASNLWFYLGKTLADELAQKLYKQLGENSCIRVGDFDRAINIDKILANAGFERTNIPFVYEKNL